MCGPPETRKAPRHREPDRKEPQPDDIAETAPDRQAPSALDLQIFCLARRFALNASLAEAVAVLVYGGLRT
jgi:hypothetical protein